MNDADNNWQSPPSNEGLISLGLRIPDQTPPKAESFLLDAKETGAWFSTLPMANIGESARRIYSTLVECNRVEMPHVVRARVIEQFRQPITYICTNLEKRYIDLGLPLSSKNRKTASLVKELHAELAVGYKIIVEHMLRPSTKRFDEKLMVIALHRALFHLSRVLLHTAMVYGPWPTGLWREIHSIYAYAAHNDVQDVAVKDELHKEQGVGSSIEDLYKATLLFSAADPLRLRQSQIRQVHHKANAWAQYTDIDTIEKDDVKIKGCFNLDLWSDMPPVHNALNPPTRSRRVRLFDVTQLIRSLREQFDIKPQDVGNKPQPDRLTGYTIRTLLSNWSSPSDRRFVRTHLNFELQLAVGFNAIIEVLGGSELQPPANPGMKNQHNEITPAVSPHTPGWAASMPNDLALSPMDTNLSSNLASSDAWAGGVNTHPPQTINPLWIEQDSSDDIPPPAVETVNESAGGYCIRWPANNTPKVKIGDAIGIKSSSNKNNYGVGLLRWLKQDPNRDLEVGMEIIAPRCRVAVIHAAQKSTLGKRSPRHRCLLLPETNRGAGDNNLLTSVMDMEIGTEGWLEVNGERRLIRFTRLMETAGALARYEYRYTNLDGDGDNELGQFDDLWGNI